VRPVWWLWSLAVVASAWGQPADDEGPAGYTPDEPDVPVLRFVGYLDVGFAKAFGTGSSFVASDRRVPLDYGSDAFAPAVNARGEVASTDTDGRFTNGFLPRSVGIAGRPSFLLNTLSLDMRVQPRGVPLFVFARVQLMPRFSTSGDVTRLELQQAFARWSPFTAHELALSLGRFDSVFGIEYLENEANLRVGLTPSLIARYTTGHGLGAKVLYRAQIAPLQSAVSINVAATTNGTRIEALAPASASLTGVVVASGRLGYELNTQAVQVKVGVSGLFGPRNDAQPTLTGAWSRQWAVAGDVRIAVKGVSLAAELIHLRDDPGLTAGKQTGQGAAEIASGFTVTGGWARLAWALPLTPGKVFQALTLYGRYDRRHGQFDGFTLLVTDRLSAGVKLDLWEMLSLKAEFLANRELEGAPPVDNDMVTTSVVFSW
jgi:hypothetical protein